MTPGIFLATSLLLGCFVVAAGGYGVLYGLGRIRRSRRLLAAANLAYGTLCVIVAGILTMTPLDIGWKLLIGASAVIYYAIPPVTWRHLHRIHRDDGANT